MTDEIEVVEKKSLKVLPLPGTTHCRIAWTNGGEVPASISGSYTTPYMAKQAILAWYAANDRQEQMLAPVEVVTLNDVLEREEEKRKPKAKREASPI